MNQSRILQSMDQCIMKLTEQTRCRSRTLPMLYPTCRFRRGRSAKMFFQFDQDASTLRFRDNCRVHSYLRRTTFKRIYVTGDKQTQVCPLFGAPGLYDRYSDRMRIFRDIARWTIIDHTNIKHDKKGYCKQRRGIAFPGD